MAVMTGFISAGAFLISASMRRIFPALCSLDGAFEGDFLAHGLNGLVVILVR